MTASQLVPSAELRDFVDLNFARRLEMAETLTPDHVRALRRFAPEATAEIFAGGTAVFGGGVYPANHIVGMGLYGPVNVDDVDRVEEFYRSRGVPCEIVVSPLADRSLLEVLAPRGYRVTEFNSVLIRRLHEDSLIEPATEITVERVTEATEQIWDRVIAKGFAEFGPLPENLFAAFASVPDTLCFLARRDGQAGRGSSGRDHAGGEHRRHVRHRDASGVSPSRGADSVDSSAAVGGGKARLRIRCREYAARQRLAAQHGTHGLSRGLHQIGDGANVAGADGVRSK